MSRSVGKPALGLYKIHTVQKLNYVFFQLRSKNLQNLNAIQFLQVLDSVLSYSDIWGSRNDSYMDNIWELPRNCDHPDCDDDDNADNHVGLSGDGGWIALL